MRTNTTSESRLRKSLELLIEKSDDLIAAIEGVTDQFEPEVAELSAAASAAEKALSRIGGQQ